MPYKQYSDSYLLKLNKKEIIDLLRVAEHNFFATEEGLQNSARFGAEILAENAELKRLLKLAADDMYNSVNDVHCKYCSKWHTDQCQGTSHLDCYFENKFRWRYADEAMKLINESKSDQ